METPNSFQCDGTISRMPPIQQCEEVKMSKTEITPFQQCEEMKTSKTKITLTQQSEEEKPCISKMAIGLIVVLVLLMVSIGLNIYWGIMVYREGQLYIERRSFNFGQSCQFVQYNVSLYEKGTIMNSNPSCVKNSAQSVRLLEDCYMYTPDNKTCLYCIKYDSSGECIQLSNRDPMTQNVPGIILDWIKCMIDNRLVIVYGLQKCTLLGLQQFIIDQVEKALSTGQIAGISVASIGGFFCLICMCCLCAK